MIIFDIETGPLPLDKLRSICKPFDASTVPHPGSFDPASVKCGNLKDQTKINEKIESARAAHELAVANHTATIEQAEAGHWSEIQSKAALSALTGEVLAIGYLGNKLAIDHGRDEREMLAKFWIQFNQCRSNNRKMVGFNITEFDIPFLVQRSWILGVSVPRSVYSQGRYLDSIFVDLMKVWAGPAWKQYVSLDACCRACGIGEKPADVTGAMFAELYRCEETRQQAIDYLINDLKMTAALAERMGV